MVLNSQGAGASSKEWWAEGQGVVMEILDLDSFPVLIYLFHCLTPVTVKLPLAVYEILPPLRSANDLLPESTVCELIDLSFPQDSVYLG